MDACKESLSGCVGYDEDLLMLSMSGIYRVSVSCVALLRFLVFVFHKPSKNAVPYEVRDHRARVQDEFPMRLRYSEGAR